MLFRCQCIQRSTEVCQFLTCLARLFLFGLRFLYCTNRIFNAGIGFLKHAFRFFFCLPDNLFPGFLQFFYLCLVTGNGFFHVLFPLTDSLTFSFPVTLVAHNVLKVFVCIDIFASYDFRSICDDIFR